MTATDDEVTYGALFMGYGGLELGAQQVIPGRTIWYSEIDPGACRILAHHHPDVPNLGDVRLIDWSTVARPTILTLGFPCQDVSGAGKRAGLMHGTRSGLFHEAAKAIHALRPSLVIIENVRGLLTAEGDTSPEYEAAMTRVHLTDHLLAWLEDRRARATCEGRTDHVRRLTDRTHRVMGLHRRYVDAARRAARRIVRAIGTVLGTLADLGYDTEWVGLRAADVGAPHGRFRVFIVAYPQGDPWRVEHGDGGIVADTGGVRRGPRGPAGPRETEGGRPLGDVAGRSLLPTPRVSSANGTSQREIDAGNPKRRLEVAAVLLPTPRKAAGRTSRGAMTRPDGHWAAPSLEQAIELANGELPREFKDWEEVPGQSRLLGTPTARDFKGERDNDESLADGKRRGRVEAQLLMLPDARLLPTPTAQDSQQSGGAHPKNVTLSDATQRQPQKWGEYAPAIHHWETLTRPAPAPTQPGPKGAPRLAPEFSEWMMGLPEGHVTAVPGLTRNEALRAIGNGVCPPQAAAGIGHLIDRIRRTIL